MSSQRNTFTGSIGFVLAAAGSAVGLGNIWRFPYLAAKDGGGLFLLVYLLLAVTFGFTLLTTEIAIGRKTRESALTAYKKLRQKWGWLGYLSCIVPIIIISYYNVIGGWVLKYLVEFLTGHNAEAAEASFFSGFISSPVEPLVYTFLFLLSSSLIVYRGVSKGIEAFSKILMPILVFLVVGIAVFSLTITHTDSEGVTRTSLEGLKIFIIPDFSSLTLNKFLITLVDAMGQLFYSLSIAMGVMIAYGSYVKKEDNLVKSINRIELFDTAIAFLAGVMVIPTVYVFMGREGLDASGPGLMFIAIPKVFAQMGAIGHWVGLLFFMMVLFAALTSSVSMFESVVASFMDYAKMTRKRATIIECIIALAMGIIICLGYTHLYFEFPLPNGVKAQILDIMDYISNNVLMPVITFGTCILIGWILKPKTIIEEVTQNGERFGRKALYIIMLKYIAPAMLLVLLLKSTGLLNL